MHYGLPIFVIALVIPLFFVVGRGGYSSFGWPQSAIRVFVSVILLIAACGHFLRPAMFAAAIPPAFPDRYALAIISGVCEAAGGIGIFIASTRRAAALCLAIFMVAIFPANIYIAAQVIGPVTMPGVPVRGAMQIVFIAMILLGGWGVPHPPRHENLTTRKP
jgi:uncharacterized membrane protein